MTIIKSRNVIMLLFVIACCSCVKYLWGIKNEKEPYYIAEELADSASKMSEKGKYKEVIQLTGNALAIYSTHVLSFYIRGKAFFFDGNIDSAKANINKAIELHKPFAQAYGFLGYIYAEIGNYHLSEINYYWANYYYHDAFSIDSTGHAAALIHSSWAETLIALKDYSAAKKELLKAISEDSTYGYAFLILSMLCEDKKEALNYVEIATKLNCDSDEIFEAKGYIFKENCQYDSSAYYFLKSIKIKSDPERLFMFVDVIKKSGDLNEIVKIKDKIKEMLSRNNYKNSSPIQLFLMAKLTSLLHCDQEVTSNYFNWAIKNGMDSIKVELERNRRVFNNLDVESINNEYIDQRDRALELLKGELRTDSYDDYLRYAEILSRMGMYHSAKGLLEFIEKSYLLTCDDRATINSIKGINSYYKYVNSKDRMILREAMDYWDNSLESFNMRMDIMYNRAYIYYKTGNYYGAEKNYREILKKKPSYYPCLLGLADLYSDMGGKGEIKYYEASNRELYIAMENYREIIFNNLTISKIHFQICYNILKSNASKNVTIYNAVDIIIAYNNIQKACENSNDVDAMYLLGEMIPYRNAALRELALRQLLLVLSVLIWIYLLIKRRTLRKKKIRLMNCSAIIMFIFYLYYGEIDVTGIKSISISKKNISEIIPMDLSGVSTKHLAKFE